MRRSRAFTLIELLVVIGIIGLLASVILVALQGARDKGRTGAALTFASNIYHATGDAAQFLFNFSQGSGATVNDMTGLNNNGTLVNGPTYSTDTPGTSGYSLQCNGTNQYVTVNHTSGMDSPTITVMTWAKTPAAGAAWRKIIGKGPDPTEDFGIYFIPSSGRIEIDRTINGTQAASFQTPLSYSDGTWHHIAYSYDGSTEKLYIDGKLLGSSSISGTISVSSENISICAEKSSISSQYYFNGNVDDIMYFTRALTAGEINNVYAMQAPAHFALK